MSPEQYEDLLDEQDRIADKIHHMLTDSFISQYEEKVDMIGIEESLYDEFGDDEGSQTLWERQERCRELIREEATYLAEQSLWDEYERTGHLS